MKINTIRIPEHRGVDCMRLESIELPRTKSVEVRVRHEAISANFIDAYHFSGLYKLPLPSGIGVDATGVVRDISADLTTFARG